MRISIFNILVFFTLVFFINSCEHDIEIDKRNNLVGDYSGWRYSKSFNIAMTSPNYDTSLVTITCIKDPSSSNGIIINDKIYYLDNNNHVDTFLSTNHESVIIQFYGDSLYYYFNFSSPGGYSTSTFRGKKNN